MWSLQPKSGNEEASRLPRSSRGLSGNWKQLSEKVLSKRGQGCHQPTPTEKFKAKLLTEKEMLNHRADVLLFTPKSFTWKAKAVNSWSLHMLGSLQQEKEDKETHSFPFHCHPCSLVSPRQSPKPYSLTFQQELSVHYMSIVKIGRILWEGSTKFHEDKWQEYELANHGIRALILRI